MLTSTRHLNFSTFNSVRNLYRTKSNSTATFAFAIPNGKHFYLDEVSIRILNGTQHELIVDGGFESGNLNTGGRVFCSPSGLSSGSVVTRISTADPGMGSFVFFSSASNETRYLWQTFPRTPQGVIALKLTFGMSTPGFSNTSNGSIHVYL